MPDGQFLWFLIAGFFGALAFRFDKSPITAQEVGRRFWLAFLAAAITIPCIKGC